MNYSARSLLSFASFNLGWWACAIGPKLEAEWIGPATMPLWLGLHFYFAPASTRRGEALFLFTLAIGGFCVDTTLIYFRVFHILPETDSAPVWLVCMWILLGLTFESMLVVRRRYALVVLLGIFSGPLSYLFAQAVNIIQYHDPAWRNLAFHALLWAVMMPELFKLRDFAFRLTRSAPHHGPLGGGGSAGGGGTGLSLH